MSASGAPVTGDGASDLDLQLIDRLERASVECWPPTAVDELADGWILRATPDLDRGRCCHALTPRTRTLGDGELRPALERVRAWSALHGIRGGLQISPLELHGAVVPGLVAAGWEPMWKVWVMVADREEAIERSAARSVAECAGQPELRWSAERGVSHEWLSAWGACQPGVGSATRQAHRNTVFTGMGERGIFGRIDRFATGIAVEDHAGEWTGLFSLVVDEGLRGRGLGRFLVRSLLESATTPRVFLQVETKNAVALSMYESFGFRVSHTYEHLRAPEGWAVTA